MDEFTIWCTPEQTRKALKLGASIELESEYYNPTEHDFKLDNPIPCEIFTNGYHYAKCPAAEQMIGWLELQINDMIVVTPYEYIVSGVDCKYGFKSRSEATLEAINVTLKHLSNKK